MKRINSIIKKACPVVGSMLTTVAVAGGVKAFSFWTFYQPKAPKCLGNK